MSSTVQEIADLIRFQLHDTDAAAYRWSDDEIIAYINAAIRQVATLVPEAGHTSQGVSGQLYSEEDGFNGYSFSLDTIDDELPVFADANRYFEVMNVCYTLAGDDEGRRGANIPFVAQDVMDVLQPDWHTVCPYTEDEALERMNAGTYYQNVVYQAQRPRVGYLYPIGLTFDDALPEIPAIRITYSRVPVAVDHLVDEIPFMSSVYNNALMNYACHLALAGEGREKQEEASKLRHDMFMQDLGLEVGAQKKVRPVRPPKEA